ncbi:MAG: response regulator [Chloroflexi bacterium]|nr:response regulator [Chloroflexota bacterium]
MATILIVEDDHHLREDIAEILTFKNYSVITAQNGREGLEMARQYLPDLIISDIMMPELDGFGFLLSLREDKNMAAIPFIFLTARTDYSDQRKGMSFGADDYLFKPFNPIDLLNSVSMRLEKQAELKQRAEQEVSTLRNSVVSMMPHELRTPLTGIIGYVDLLVNDFEDFDTKQVLRMLQNIQKSSYRLFRIVQNYLLYTQLEIMGLDPERRALINQYKGQTTADPADIFSRVSHNKAIQYNRFNDLTVELPPGVAHILGDDLEKIAEELVDNAFKFSQQGSAISIIGQPEAQGYRIWITDHGWGMRPDQLSKIGGMVQFDRHIHEQQGAGLGLVIARRLTEVYGGQFSIESEYEKGTTVCIVV